MATLVWLHARESTQLPIYDAFTYYSKAKHVWAALASGDFASLLDVEPAFRPPATVLMSYPFGFDGHFPGFYFRSVFFPIALVFVAVYVAAWRTGPRVDVLFVATTAAFLTTLSLFYYFEPYTDGPPMIAYWGLVDNFLTGLAALAAACAVRSARVGSPALGLATTVIGVVMIFVKPSGALLAALVGVVLTLGWLVGQWPALNDRRTRIRTLAALGTLVVGQAVLLGGSVLLATQSSYLGASSIEFGNASIEVMRSELKVDLRALLAVIHSGLGLFIPIWVIGIAMFLFHDRFLRRRQSPGAGSALDDLCMAMSVVVLVVGAWFWLVASGGQTQIRYFTPFLYVAIVCSLPPLADVMARRRRRQSIRRFTVLLMVVAIGNTVLLLAVPNPSLAWQIASGVNVMSGSKPTSIAQAQSVIAAMPRGATVYSLSIKIADAMFETVFRLHTLNGGEGRFYVRRPVDWSRPSTFRTSEIADAAYILFQPPRPVRADPEPVRSLDEEGVVFHNWARRLSSSDGVERISAAPDSVLLKVVDQERLVASLDRLIGSHRWRPLFSEVNPLRWWSKDEVDRALAGARPAVEDIRFGETFEAPAALLVPLAEGALDLRLWLRPLDPTDSTGWIALVHAVDADGKILTAPDLVLGPMTPPTIERPYRYFHHRIVPPAGTTSVAIGLYRGPSILTADKGTRDWGDRRILLPMPESAGAIAKPLPARETVPAGLVPAQAPR